MINPNKNLCQEPSSSQRRGKRQAAAPIINSMAPQIMTKIKSAFPSGSCGTNTLAKNATAKAPAINAIPRRRYRRDGFSVFKTRVVILPGYAPINGEKYNWWIVGFLIGDFRFSIGGKRKSPRNTRKGPAGKSKTGKLFARE